MASIKSQLALNDGMSGILRKITAALDTTLASFEQMQRASGQAMDLRQIEEARGLLVGAGNALDDMADQYSRAAQEEQRLNDGIRQGASAADGMLRKVVSLVGAYASISSIKGFASDSMAAANVQINAQRQLRTVLDNMGAEESYAAFSEGVANTPPEASLVLDTKEASSAYEDILQKASEIQGKGIYGDEAMIAGAAEFATYFEDANAILSMMDTLSNYAMGMSGGGELDSNAMVDYATGIGKLMTGSYGAMTKKGFEFSDAQKAIIEGTATEAQIAAELGEEYLNMSSDMQAAAAIDAVISESWGGLYEAMSNTPEGKLIQLNNTLGDIKENVGAGIYPAVEGFVEMVQSHLPQIERAAMGVASAIGIVSRLLTAGVEAGLTFGTAIADNWSWIAPIVWTVVAALAAYNGYLAVSNALEALSGIQKGLAAVAAYAHAAATDAEARAAAAATAAQYGFNAALLASPVTWVVIGLIALVAAIMAGVRALDLFGAESTSIFGTFMGVLNVVKQFILNVIAGVWAGFSALCSNIVIAFGNAIANVQGKFYSLLSTALDVIAGICSALNKLPFVEFDFSGITSKANEYASKAAAAYDKKQEYTSISDAFLGAWDTGWAADAFASGAAWGDGVANKVGGLFDYTPGTIQDYADQGMSVGPAADAFAMDDLGSDVGDIAENTGAAAKSLEVSGEELKYLRDIAERDAINRFTTAEVKIDMTGMTNRIDSSLDIDGVIRELTDGFSEALATAAEGVHE